MFLVRVVNTRNSTLASQNNADPIYQKLKSQRKHKRFTKEKKLNHGENNEQPDNEGFNHQANHKSVFVKFELLDAVISSCKCRSKASNKVRNYDEDHNDSSSQTSVNFELECTKINDDLDIITLESMK